MRGGWWKWRCGGIDAIIGMAVGEYLSLLLLSEGRAGVVGENAVFLGRWSVDGWYALLLSTRSTSPKLRRTEETEPPARGPPQTLFRGLSCKVYASPAFFFFLSTTKTTNSNHRLCLPTLESTLWRWRLRWTGRERIVTFKTIVARVVSSETAPMIRE